MRVNAHIWKLNLTWMRVWIKLSPAHAETLWRVAQEALANIERHAVARNAELQLHIESSVASLSIKDDGRGLPS